MPAEVVRDIVRPKADGSSNDLANEVRDVEKGRQDGTFLGVRQFTNQRGRRHDTSWDSESEDKSRRDVHAHYQTLMLIDAPVSFIVHS